MPVYESVLQEKPPMVFEIGSALTKIGFATEAFPRFVVPMRLSDSEVTNMKDWDVVQLYDYIVNLFSKFFFKCLLVSPKDRKIVVVENIFSPTIVRESIAKALFRHFEVSSLLYTPAHMVVLATLALDTALVINIGYRETTVVPVYSGVHIMKAFQSQSYGGEAVEMFIKQSLLDGGNETKNLTSEVIEDIKVRACFVASKEKIYEKNAVDNCQDICYTLNGKDVIKIPGKLRGTVMEIFFPKDNENAGLPNIILNALASCPRDTRKSLAANIVFTGGMAMTPGLLARLKLEIFAQLRSNSYKRDLFIDSLNFHLNTVNSVNIEWLGGSIYGGTDLLLSKSVTKETYLQLRKMPDWCVL